MRMIGAVLGHVRRSEVRVRCKARRRCRGNLRSSVAQHRVIRREEPGVRHILEIVSRAHRTGHVVRRARRRVGRQQVDARQVVGIRRRGEIPPGAVCRERLTGVQAPVQAGLRRRRVIRINRLWRRRLVLLGSDGLLLRHLCLISILELELSVFEGFVCELLFELLMFNSTLTRRRKNRRRKNGRSDTTKTMDDDDVREVRLWMIFNFVLGFNIARGTFFLV